MSNARSNARPDVECFDVRMRRGGEDAIREMCLFCARIDGAYERINEFGRQLRADNVEYALAGGLAMAAHGMCCGTWELIVVVCPEDVATVRERTRVVADGMHFMRVEVHSAPGVAHKRVEIDGAFYLSLHALIEMKLSLGGAKPG